MDNQHGFKALFCWLVVGLSIATAQDGDWKVVWSDEFEGKSLDYSKWEIEVNAFGGGNNELQIYTDRSDNVRVEDGLLVIEAHRERTGIAGTERDFSSGRIRSKRRGDWTYGRFEARMKLPKGPATISMGLGPPVVRSTSWSSRARRLTHFGGRFITEEAGPEISIQG
jgi:hypothetical protein